jgi:Fe2+ or Zn2+ uptake regulation protein
MKTPEELTELFRSNGRKVTAQRQCIFRVLQGDVTHPSAEAVHAMVCRQMETISLKTVYQTLHDLAELGEIDSLDVGTGSVEVCVT